MKARFAKMAGVLLVGADTDIRHCGRAELSDAACQRMHGHGDLGMVELRDGQRHFLCWDGQWQFLYECTYSGNSCVIH